MPYAAGTQVTSTEKRIRQLHPLQCRAFLLARHFPELPPTESPIIRLLLPVCGRRIAFVTPDGAFLGVAPDTTAMGRALDVLWCDLSVAKANDRLRPNGSTRIPLNCACARKV